MRKYLLVAATLVLSTAWVRAAAQSVPPAQTQPQATQIKGVPPGAVVGSAYRKPVQSAPPRKDIPAIAKAANGSIVSVVMSDKDGKPIAQGSGFLVSKDGLIVTNYHVISEGSSAIAKFPDGALFVVDGVVASDKTRDVAVIQAHGKNFRTLTLGNSDRVQVGEEVVAIGNPLSLESTVSNGIVSGIRTVKEEGGNFLQVTAPISPGSSGGPLFNMAGEVVGITTLYLKGGENLNFAIPINDAKRLLLNRSANLQNFNETEPNEPKEAQPHYDVRVEGEPPPTPPAIPTLDKPTCDELTKNQAIAMRSEEWQLVISTTRQYLGGCLSPREKMQVKLADGSTLDLRDGLETIELFSLSIALAKLKEFESALKASRRCVAIDATAPPCWVTLGDALRGVGKIPEAKEAFERTIDTCQSKSPEYCAPYVTYAKRQLAQISSRSGQP